MRSTCRKTSASTRTPTACETARRWRRCSRSAYGTGTSAEWEAKLTAAGVPVSPIRDVGEAFDHEQTRALGILQQLGEGTTVSPPFSVDGERIRHRTPPPRLGDYEKG